MINTIWQDLRYGFRELKNKPGFTFVALLIIALGIGANTALFSILYSILWKPFPYGNPDQLAIVWETNRQSNNVENVVNTANFYDWKEQNRVFTDMAGFFSSAGNLDNESAPEEIPIQYVTSNFFQVLKVNPVLGRTFLPADDESEELIVILSHGLWLRKFAGDRNIVGKKILLNGRSRTVVGVAPAGFHWFIKHGWMTSKPPQLWTLLTITPEMRNRRGGRWLSVVARMKPDVTAQQADENMSAIAKQLESQYYEFNAGWGANVVPLREQLSGQFRKPLWILTGAVAFVLLISCSNVANLLLSRAVSRKREMAVRAALGAGRSRIIRQLLTESVLMSFLGGLAGILLAYWGVSALATLGYRAGIDFTNVELNWVMFSFAFGLSFLTGIVFGLVPSLTASRTNLNEELKEGSRGTIGHSGGIRDILVVTEVAVTLVLLIGAALLIQSFWRLSSVDPGFNPKNVLSFRVVLPSIKYPENSQKIAWFRNLIEKFENTPGVKSVGMVSFLPFGGPGSQTSFYIVGQPKPLPGQEPSTWVFMADDGFFETVQIPLLRGRTFTVDEMRVQRNVVLVNQSLVNKYFPGQDPIGKQIEIHMRDENVPSEIVGIVGDVKNESMDVRAEPSVYWPHSELPLNFMNILIRTERDPLAFAPTAISTVRNLDSGLPLADLREMEEWVGDSTARARFSMVLLLTLAVLALILALAGIYGVLSHTVVQRTQEMGIRMALGASGSDVFALLLKHSSKLILAGILLGLAISIALTRLMQTMLYETSTYDPVVFTVIIAFMVLAALLASSIPSRRAAKVEPLVALRYE
jgi:putative ABC transport system permease protein